MLTKFLIAIGVRSSCCGAKIETWEAGKDICSSCLQWLRKDVSLEAVESIQAPLTVTRPALKLKRAVLVPRTSAPRSKG